MKVILVSLAILSLGLQAQDLKPGSKVTIDAIHQADFIQGKAPAAWEPGKLYILECWATWCGPCIAVIPHVDELHDKHHEKGLRVIGMNVWEDGREKVADFVKGRGDGMSYPVAYVGKGGVFENEWLKAAGIRGIPHAFLVRDGELLLTTHPAQLKEATVLEILAGGDRSEAAIKSIRNAQENSGKTREILRAYSKADGKQDAEGMMAAIKDLESLDPTFTHLPRMKVEHAVLLGNWDEATTLMEAIEDKRVALMAASIVTNRLDEADPAPPAPFLQSVVKALDGAPPEDVVAKCCKARMLWKLDRKEDATKVAQEAAANPGIMPKDVLQAFADSFTDGTPQTVMEMMRAMQAANQAQPKR